MEKEYNKLINSDFLNECYRKSAEEDFVGSETKRLINKCQLLLYYYPLVNNYLMEQNLSEFYIANYNKIRNTIYNYDKSNELKFKTYFLNFIKISIKYYNLKVRHDYLYDNLALEVIIKHSEVFEKELIYEDKNKEPITIATFKYKFNDDQSEIQFDNSDDTNNSNGKTLSELYYLVLNFEDSEKINNTKYPKLDNLKTKINKHSTRRSVLLLLLTMPDAILENYVNEVSYLFSAKKINIILLFSSCRELQKEKYQRFEKYSQLNNKHYKNYLLNHYKLSSNLFDKDKLYTSISWDKKAMVNNANKIRQTLNIHVSQRTLAKALDIKKGTVASSISSAKSLLKNFEFVS
ncbi:MAG: hypothetical protein EOL97_10125 [Spirochaetia bacterium]|nr:hypothetical protein [Spirochaetia bacterium]